MSTVIDKRSAGGIVHADGKFLVMKAIPHDEIVLPKGTIENGETPAQTAVREVREETGYTARITDSLGEVAYEYTDNGRRYRKTVHYYLMELVDTEAAPIPDRQEGEDFDNIWLSADDALSLLTHDPSKAMLQKALLLLTKS